MKQTTIFGYKPVTYILQTLIIISFIMMGYCFGAVIRNHQKIEEIQKKIDALNELVYYNAWDDGN